MILCGESAMSHPMNNDEKININKEWMRGCKAHLELRQHCACVLLEFLRALKPQLSVHKAWLVHVHDRRPDRKPDYTPEEALYSDGQDEDKIDLKTVLIRLVEKKHGAVSKDKKHWSISEDESSFVVLIGLVLEGTADEYPSELLMLPARITVAHETWPDLPSGYNRARLEVMDQEPLDVFIPLPLLAPNEGKLLYKEEDARIQEVSRFLKPPSKPGTTTVQAPDPQLASTIKTFAERLEAVAAKQDQELASIPKRYRTRTSDGLKGAAKILQHVMSWSGNSPEGQKEELSQEDKFNIANDVLKCNIVLQGRGGPGLKEFAIKVADRLKKEVRDADFIWKSKTPRMPGLRPESYDPVSEKELREEDPPEKMNSKFNPAPFFLETR
jgi:hypothetical protein